MFCVSVCITMSAEKKVIIGVVLKAPTILDILVFNQSNLEYGSGYVYAENACAPLQTCNSMV